MDEFCLAVEFHHGGSTTNGATLSSFSSLSDTATALKSEQNEGRLDNLQRGLVLVVVMFISAYFSIAALAYWEQI